MSPLPFIQLLLLRAKIMNCCHVIIRKMSFDVSNLDHDPPNASFYKTASLLPFYYISGLWGERLGRADRSGRPGTQTWSGGSGRRPAGIGFHMMI